MESKTIFNEEAVLLLFILPFIVEFFILIVNSELESTTKSPSIVWLTKFKSTSAPFSPIVPQCEFWEAFKNTPDPYKKWQFSKVILVWVLVTKKKGAVEYTLLFGIIWKYEFKEWKKLLVIFGSPGCDW